jgi:hypothetical protein
VHSALQRSIQLLLCRGMGGRRREQEGKGGWRALSGTQVLRSGLSVV